MSQYLNPNGEEFFAQISSYLSIEDRARVRQAFELARKEHGDVRRKSGELFFTHPLTVAYYLAEYYADAPALIAALLHDVAEDTSVSVGEIQAQFGEEVSLIVDGLTKFDRVTAKAKLGRELSPDEVKEATLYKLFDMMTEDVRVGIIKIFDRLHNMRTITSMPLYKQKEKAREALSVYAPLANRLGMWKIKNELESLSLSVLDGMRFKNLQEQLKERLCQQEPAYKAIREELLTTLKQAGVTVIDVVTATDDVLTLYNTWRKNGSQGLDIPIRLVVLVEDVASCYLSLGHIHGRWRPVQKEFDDYIAAPRDNLYRSLHTTVIYEGKHIKVRFRTFEMQLESQSGVLSQWMDHAGMPITLWSKESLSRLETMIGTISDSIKFEKQEVGQGVRSVIEDIFTKQIIVYTPQGEMRELPQGATPVDFAYSIHTAIGNSCRAALVNGKHVPLNTQLNDGDSVTILRHGSQPQRTWLDEDLGYLNMAYSKSAVRKWYRKLPADKAIKQGKRLLQAELEMLGLSDYSHLVVASWFGLASPQELYYELGSAEILPTTVAIKVLADLWRQEPLASSNGGGQTVASENGEWFVITNAGDRPLRLCRTCNPRPGDNIQGFIRKDGEVTVHNLACPLLHSDDVLSSNLLKLRWGEEGHGNKRAISMRIDVHDRDGLLFEIGSLMQEEKINITSLCSRSKNHKATIVFGAEIASPRQLVRILHRAQALVNVIGVRCMSHLPKNGSGDQDGMCLFNQL